MFIPCKIFSLAIFLLSFPFCLNLHLIVSAARSIISTKHSIYDYWSGRTDWSQHITIFASPAYLRYTGHEEARRWWMLDIPHKCRHNYTHYRLLPPTFGPQLDCTLGQHCTVCFKKFWVKTSLVFNLLSYTVTLYKCTNVQMYKWFAL